MAMLMALQAEVTDTRLLSLSAEEVAQLMTFRGSFQDSLVLAQAYGCNRLKVGLTFFF